MMLTAEIAVASDAAALEDPDARVPGRQGFNCRIR